MASYCRQITSKCPISAAFSFNSLCFEDGHTSCSFYGSVNFSPPFAEHCMHKLKIPFSESWEGFFFQQVFSVIGFLLSHMPPQADQIGHPLWPSSSRSFWSFFFFFLWGFNEGRGEFQSSAWSSWHSSEGVLLLLAASRAVNSALWVAVKKETGGFLLEKDSCQRRESAFLARHGLLRWLDWASSALEVALWSFEPCRGHPFNAWCFCLGGKGHPGLVLYGMV